MGEMESAVIDLVPKGGVFVQDKAFEKGQDLSKPLLKVRKRGKKEYLMREQINPILRMIADSRDRLYITLLWKTGIRVTESINIEKRHLNGVAGRLTIRWLKSRKWEEREINIPFELMEQLLIYARPLRFDERLFSFTRQRASQITMRYFGVSPHVFRHSFAMHWVEQDLPIDVLQLQLGHARIQTTMEYVHTSMRRARTYLDRVVW